MRMFCAGVGVFDTDNARTHRLNPSSAPAYQVVLYELDAGETWVRQRAAAPNITMDKIAYDTAASLFTEYGIEVPESLAKHLW